MMKQQFKAAVEIETEFSMAKIAAPRSSLLGGALGPVPESKSFNPLN